MCYDFTSYSCLREKCESFGSISAQDTSKRTEVYISQYHAWQTFSFGLESQIFNGLLITRLQELQALKSKLTTKDDVIVPTTPSWLLVKSSKQSISLKPITEDEESDFSEELSNPLPTLIPLSLLPRLQKGTVFKPKESTSIVNPFSFHVSGYGQSIKPNLQELGNLEPKTASYFLATSVKKHTTLKTIIEDEQSDFSEELSKPFPTLRPLSLLPRLQKGTVFKPKESTSIVNPFSFHVSGYGQSIKPNLQELGNLEPKTASYFLATSVKKHTTLKTIIEDERSDFSEEFSKPFPTLRPLSLLPRLQKGTVFNPKESTSIVNPFSFSVTACGKSKFEYLELGPVEPKTASYFLVTSVKKRTTLKTIPEDEESDFSDGFSKPLSSPRPLTLIPRKQQGAVFNEKESTAAVSCYSFSAQNLAEVPREKDTTVEVKSTRETIDSVDNLMKRFASDHSIIVERSNKAVSTSVLERQQLSVEENQSKTEKQAILSDISTAVDVSCARNGSKSDGAERAVWASELEQQLIARDQTTNFETVIGRTSNECRQKSSEQTADGGVLSVENLFIFDFEAYKKSDFAKITLECACECNFCMRRPTVLTATCSASKVKNLKPPSPLVLISRVNLPKSSSAASPRRSYSDVAKANCRPSTSKLMPACNQRRSVNYRNSLTAGFPRQSISSGACVSSAVKLARTMKGSTSWKSNMNSSPAASGAKSYASVASAHVKNHIMQGCSHGRRKKKRCVNRNIETYNNSPI